MLCAHPSWGPTSCCGQVRAPPLPCCLPACRGALADVILWLLIRLQTHMFGSETYGRWATAMGGSRAGKREGGAVAAQPAAPPCPSRRAVAVVEQEEAAERQELEAEVRLGCRLPAYKTHGQCLSCTGRWD